MGDIALGCGSEAGEAGSLRWGLTSLVSLGRQILWQIREMLCSVASTSTWCGGCFRGPVLEPDSTRCTCHLPPHPGHQPLSELLNYVLDTEQEITPVPTAVGWLPGAAPAWGAQHVAQRRRQRPAWTHFLGYSRF